MDSSKRVGESLLVYKPSRTRTRPHGPRTRRLTQTRARARARTLNPSAVHLQRSTSVTPRGRFSSSGPRAAVPHATVQLLFFSINIYLNYARPHAPTYVPWGNHGSLSLLPTVRWRDCVAPWPGHVSTAMMTRGYCRYNRLPFAVVFGLLV